MFCRINFSPWHPISEHGIPLTTVDRYEMLNYVRLLEIPCRKISQKFYTDVGMLFVWPCAMCEAALQKNIDECVERKMFQVPTH